MEPTKLKLNYGKWQHNATVKDERTYKRFGEPVNRASGSAGAKIELEKGMMGSNMPKPKLKAGGKITASSRADGIAQRGKTRGRIV